MRKQILFLFAALVFMGGCSLAPNYTQPKAPIPNEWPQGAAYEDTRDMPGTPTDLELKWRIFLQTNSFKRY